MLLIRSTITLYSKGDGMVAITGYDGGYDGFLAGLLGCLPRCLYSLWVMNGMTQHQIKINGPDSDILVRRTMDDRGRRGGVEQRHTAGDTYCEGVVYHFDWPPGLCGLFVGPY